MVSSEIFGYLVMIIVQKIIEILVLTYIKSGKLTTITSIYKTLNKIKFIGGLEE